MLSKRQLLSSFAFSLLICATTFAQVDPNLSLKQAVTNPLQASTGHETVVPSNIEGAYIDIDGTAYITKNGGATWQLQIKEPSRPALDGLVDFIDGHVRIRPVGSSLPSHISVFDMQGRQIGTCKSDANESIATTDRIILVQMVQADGTVLRGLLVSNCN